jgi:hypothetical protein
LFSIAAALVVSVPVVARARHGADDGKVELRHRADDHAARERNARTSRVSKVSAAELRRGADDPRGDDYARRDGHGGDDGPGHH